MREGVREGVGGAAAAHGFTLLGTLDFDFGLKI